MKATKVLLMFLGLAAMAAPSHATSITYELNYEFSGATQPTGATPWLTATFDDGGGTGTVTLTMESSGLSADEFVRFWYFNFDPDLDATDLTIVNTDGEEAVSVEKGENSFKADGDGFFDILFTFDNAPPSDRFTANLTSVYVFTLAGITASSFDFSSVQGGGNGTYHTAAHIQTIGPDEESGWIGDKPEDVPDGGTTLSLLGGALLGLGMLRRRFNR